jgi:hypothetical protein
MEFEYDSFDKGSSIYKYLREFEQTPPKRPSEEGDRGFISEYP